MGKAITYLTHPVRGRMIPPDDFGCWFTWPLGDGMDQINTGVFYTLGKQVQDCFLRARMQIKLWSQSAQNAKDALDGLIRGDGFFRFDESSGAASALSAVLGGVLASHKADGEAKLSDDEVARFNMAVFTFDQAITLELGRAPMFFVTPKGVYDTRRLIANADSVYAGYADRLPKETLADTKDAGRCLAFSLYTAAGFHIARATEAVIKQYMAAIGCDAPKDSQRNWGAYTRLLVERGANKIIVHHIDQLRELHRNPITHPEVTLTMGDAIALQAMCHSVIQAMVADMEARSKTPDPGIVSLLPADSLSISSAGSSTVAATLTTRLGMSDTDDAPAGKGKK